MHNVVVRSLVLLTISTAIVLVSAFALPPAAPTTPVGTSQDGMAGHEMATAVESEAAFISGMIPHHREAVESARAILSSTERPEVRTLARDVIATQTEEIALLEGWLGRWYPDAPEAAYTPMMAPASGSPAEADRAFLEGMIEHHQGALDMARAYLDADFAKHPEVVRLAEAIVAVQNGEIEQMEAWLGAWYGDAEPEPMAH